MKLYLDEGTFSEEDGEETGPFWVARRKLMKKKVLMILSGGVLHEVR